MDAGRLHGAWQDPSHDPITHGPRDRRRLLEAESHRPESTGRTWRSTVMGRRRGGEGLVRHDDGPGVVTRSRFEIEEAAIGRRWSGAIMYGGPGMTRGVGGVFG